MNTTGPEVTQRSPHDGRTTAPAVTPGSLLLGSARPGELREWYRRAFAPDQTDGPLSLGGFLLIIDGRDDVDAMNNEPGRMILNFHVTDFDAAEDHLLAAGIEWITVPEDRPGGRFATFADPDGNYLQLIQLKQAVDVHRDADADHAGGEVGAPAGLRRVSVNPVASSTGLGLDQGLISGRGGCPRPQERPEP